jgi:hypothetical protein
VSCDGYPDGLFGVAVRYAPVLPVSAPRKRRHSKRSGSDLRSRPFAVFSAALAVLFLTMAVWSLATPLFAAPDEWAQVERAVALAHGELVGTTVKNDGNASTDISIPEFYTVGGLFTSCYFFKESVPASCTGPATGTSTVVPAQTYVGRYPPLYYALVGWPSLLTVSSKGIYLMRLASSFVNSALLALAVMAVVRWSNNRLLLMGLLLATTPMAFFLGSVINPSGFEIAAAICFWCSSLVLALERPREPPRGLVAIAALSGGTLLLARPLSPLWFLVILFLVALLAGVTRIRELVTARSVRWALGSLAVVGVAAVTWIAEVHSLDLLPIGRPLHGSFIHVVTITFGETGTWFRQMVGIFGPIDTPSPLVTYLIWYAAAGAVVLLALAAARGRQIVSLVLLATVVVLAPVLIADHEVYRLGLVWQGRYILPMAVGIPIMAVVIIGCSDRVKLPEGRMCTILCVLLGVADFAAIAGMMRRYTVGTSGPIDYLHGSWQPPFGALVLTVWALVATVFLTAFVRYLIALPTKEYGAPSRNGAGDEVSSRVDSGLAPAEAGPLDPAALNRQGV